MNENAETQQEYLGRCHDCTAPQTEVNILSRHILELQNDKGKLIDRCRDLEAQIEKMKCCANCLFSESDRLNGIFCHKEGCFVLASAKCKLWER